MRTKLTTGATVTAGGPLDTAQQSLARQPVVQATIRDTRLRFATTWTGTNPWAITSDADLSMGQRYVWGDSLVTQTGTILRAWGKNGNMRIQRIATPTTQSQWSHASNAYQDLVWSQDANTVPGLFQRSNGTIYIFYIRAGGIYYRTSTNDGASWSAESSMSATVSGATAVAPVSETEVFAAVARTGGIQIYRVTSGSAVVCPFEIQGTLNYIISGAEYSSTTTLDAFSLGGKTFVTIGFGDAGRGYVLQCTSGMWSEPRQILPADYAKFMPYRVEVYNNQAWLTGRIEFASAGPTATVGLDVVLRSTNGLDWTAMDRECYLTTSEIRGKLLLSGNYVYYAGIYRVYQAPATYLIGVDNASYKVALTTDLVGGSANLGAAGSAPSFDLTMTQDYFDSAVVRPGAEAVIEAGYMTSAGAQYVQLLRGGIDTIGEQVGAGQKARSCSGRDLQFKRMKDYQSPFYWRLLSQEKTYDMLDDFGLWAAWGEGVGWEANGPSQDFAKIRQEAIYASSTVTDAQGFDIRMRVANTWTTRAYRSQIGPAAYLIDKNNFWRAEILYHYAAGQDQVRLVRRVEGTDTVVASATGLTFTSGTIYWIRLVCRHGRFLVYTRTDGSSTWTQQINYTHTPDANPLCKSDSGGYAGFYAYINPLAVQIYKTSEDSPVIGMKAQQGTDWGSAFWGSTMVIDGEQITIGGKGTGTQAMTHSSNADGSGFLWAAATDASPAQGWGWHTRVSCSVGDQALTWTNYGLIFYEGGAEGYGFQITGQQAPATAGGMNLLTAASNPPHDTPSYKVFPANGWSALVAGSGSPISCRVVPAFYGCTRGVNDTEASYHADDAWATAYCDNVLKLYEVQLHDIVPADFVLESLLSKTLWMSGAVAEFTNLFSGTVTATSSTQYLRKDGTTDTGGAADTNYLDVRDGCVEFDCSSGGGVIFRASARGYPGSGGYLIQLSSGNVNFVRAGATQETVAMLQTPAYPAKVRVIWHSKATYGWITVYVNGQYVATFKDDTYNANAANYVGFLTGFSYTNVRVPELGEWRDAVRIDESSDIQKVIGDILQERPVIYLSRSGESVKFSYFDTRDTHGSPNPGAALGDLVLTDEYAPQEGELMTFVRLEADQIGMFPADSVAGTNMLTEHGFIFRNIQLPNSRASDGDRITRRIFRRMAEGYGYRSQTLRGDVLMEAEDKLSFNFTVYGSTLVRSGTMVVDDVSYSFGPAQLSMKIGVRKFVE